MNFITWNLNLNTKSIQLVQLLPPLNMSTRHAQPIIKSIKSMHATNFKFYAPKTTNSSSQQRVSYQMSMTRSYIHIIPNPTTTWNQQRVMSPLNQFLITTTCHVSNGNWPWPMTSHNRIIEASSLLSHVISILIILDSMMKQKPDNDIVFCLKKHIYFNFGAKPTKPLPSSSQAHTKPYPHPPLSHQTFKF